MFHIFKKKNTHKNFKIKTQQMSKPKFSIPLLPTLITNFYTPAPVIYPPGSDPSLLNPNLKVMDRTPSSVSMDVVDPCVVAFRSEVVVQKVDLTALEHAGVALSEHATKVSTTSTNSLQALNNVVVTENKIDDFMTSDSAKAFMKHMEGKIDLKTTHNKLTGSSSFNRETPSPVASDILDQKPEKKNHEFNSISQNLKASSVIEQETTSSVANGTLDQQEETSVDSLYVCAIPPPGQYYKKIAMVEVDESLFENPVSVKQNVQKKLKISEQTTIPMEESNSVEIEKNTIWCEKLEKTPKLPSPVVKSVTAPLAEKLTSTKGEVVNPNVRNYVKCELCGISCNSRDVLNIHIAGKKHQKKLRNTAPEGKVVILEGSKRKGNGSLSSEVEADTKRQKMDEEEVGGVLVTCKVCNVSCYGFTAHKLHLAGPAHIEMALKLGKGGSMAKGV